MTHNLKYDNLKQYKSNKIRYIFGSSTTWDRIAMYPMFDPTGVQTHNLKIIKFQVTETPALTTWPSVTSFSNRSNPYVENLSVN